MYKRNKAIFLLALFLIVLVAFAIRGESQNFAGRENILIGFWTGFFALVFLGVSSIIRKILQREKIHYNSLVTLQTQLSKMIGVIKDNIYVTKGFREVVARGNIHWGNMKPVMLDEGHFEKLHDIDLINKLFELYYDLRKMNDDWENLQGGYNDLKNAFIQKNIKVEQYVQNAILASNEFETLELFAEQTLDKLISLLVRIRIQTCRDKPFLVWIEEKFVYTSGEDITIHEFEKEKRKLETELELSSRISQKEIEKIKRTKKQ